MKRALFTMIALCCALNALSNGYTYTDSNGLKWYCWLSGNEVTLEDYTYDSEIDDAPRPCVEGTIPSYLIIPPTVKINNITYPVTNIGSYAFYDCSNITDINIPSSVKYIENLSFAGCNNLSSVHIENLSAWCDIYFEYNNSNPLYNAHHLFINEKEVTELVVPNDVKTIRSYAFEGLTNLTSVTIPNSVTSIGQYAFAYCTGLTSVTIPSRVTSIGYCAFNECPNLTSVKVYKESPLSISSYTFTNRANATLYVPAGSKAAYEAAQYWQDFGTIVEMAPVSAISFSDPNVKNICVANWDKNGDGELSEDEAAAVTNLGQAFKGNTSITSFNELQYFTGLTSIGNQTFYGCTSLISITIPNSVTSIGNNAFYACSLSSINIPTSVNTIDAGAFNECRSMSSVHITDLSAWCNISFSSNASNPLNYGHHLFLNGEEITDLVIPSGISLLMSYTFSGGYFSSVTIPSSCLFTNSKCVFAFSHIGSITINQYLAEETFIQAQIDHLVIAPEVTGGGSHAFWDTKINYLEIPYSSKTLGYSRPSNSSYALFDGCTIEKASVNRPINSDYYGSNMTPPFYNSTISELHVGSSAKFIHDWLCRSVTITDLYFDGVTDIPENAFYSTNGNNNIKNIHLSEEISSIGSYAFYNSCSSLNSVVAEMPSPPVIDSNTFNSRYTRSSATLYVLEGSKAAYEAAEYWQDFNIVEKAFSIASVVSAPTAKELVYTGSAQDLVTPGEASGGTMQYSLDGMNYSPDIPTGTDVGEYTVYYKVVGDADHSDTEPATVSVTILPSSPAITFADANVKALCVQNWDTNGDGELSEAEAAAVTTLGEVFKGNNEITSFDELHYFTGLTEIADGAFNECTNLESVILPSRVERIGNWAFTTCSSLNTITIPASVTNIGAGAFAGCNNMISMTVDAENTVYDSREDCNAIIHTSTNTLVAGCKNMTIPEGVTSIGEWALNGMGSLTSVVLPSSLTSIETGALSWCWSLPSIVIPANVTSIGDGALYGCDNLTSVTVENPEPVAIAEGTFSNRANATLYVPVGSKSVYEAADYWKEFKEIVELVNIVTNSDMEGTDNDCFFSRENYLENEDVVPSTIVEGAGVDGSRGIVIQSVDNPSETWYTQFFIRLPQTLPAGTKYHISFDYKASQEASGPTETHAEPSNYVYWDGIGTINYTTDWKHFELSGTVSAEQSPADNPMRTIAFNLAVTPTSTTYYFDNVVFEIDKSQITPVAIVTEAPTPKELTFTGEAQELINPGEASGGTMQYSLDGTNYSPDIPTGIDVGEYTVYYKVVGDADHSDTEPETVSVTIAEAMVEETDYLAAADISGIAGGSTSLVISLENEDPIYDIQFKLRLPEGVDVSKNSDNQYKVSYSDRLSGLSHEMSYREEGYYTFLIHGMENPIPGNTGAIVTIGLTLSSELAGNYNIEISDIVLTKSDATTIKPRNVDVTLSLTDGQLGDVNRDGDIDVADIRCIANHILGKPNVFFDEDAADANNDGDIDVADIRTIANIILYGSNHAAKEFTGFNIDPQ